MAVLDGPVLPLAAPDPAGEPVGGVAGWAVNLMETLGGPGAGLAVAAENLFPPLPGEVILPLAGFAASRGDLGLVSAIIWTTLGSTIGAVGLYYVGALLGRDRVRRLAARIPLVRVSDIDRSEAWFARHGAKAVFFGRMVPIFREFIAIPAGVERMPMSKYLLCTVTGTGLWNTLFIVAGYQLGENWNVVTEYADLVQLVVIAAVLGLIGYFVVSRIRRKVP